jgi:hypothetical protein
MKKQIKDLELCELDCLAAMADGLDPIVIRNNECYIANSKYSPTTNPSQAWPIIERECINIRHLDVMEKWLADIDGYEECGKTSLEAAMRAYVLAKYGDEVDLDNLINK